MQYDTYWDWKMNFSWWRSVGYYVFHQLNSIGIIDDGFSTALLCVYASNNKSTKHNYDIGYVVTKHFNFYRLLSNCLTINRDTLLHLHTPVGRSRREISNRHAVHICLAMQSLIREVSVKSTESRPLYHVGASPLTAKPQYYCMTAVSARHRLGSNDITCLVGASKSPGASLIGFWSPELGQCVDAAFSRPANSSRLLGKQL